jgi:hypothetical protein
MSHSRLTFPLFHGTSTLFLDDILASGLGAKNPLVELEIATFIEQVTPLIDSHLAATATYIARRRSFGRMAEQFTSTNGWNFQHGQTYLSPSMSTAIRYAANKRYGSEILTYALDFLQMLIDRDVPTVATDVFRQFPKVFALLDTSPAPILVRADRVQLNQLLTERGEDPMLQVDQLTSLRKETPSSFAIVAQQSNFRLSAPVHARELQVWFINVKRFNSFKPEYSLYHLGPRDHREASA